MSAKVDLGDPERAELLARLEERGLAGLVELVRALGRGAGEDDEGTQAAAHAEAYRRLIEAGRALIDEQLARADRVLRAAAGSDEDRALGELRGAFALERRALDELLAFLVSGDERHLPAAERHFEEAVRVARRHAR